MNKYIDFWKNYEFYQYESYVSILPTLRERIDFLNELIYSIDTTEIRDIYQNTDIDVNEIYFNIKQLEKKLHKAQETNNLFNEKSEFENKINDYKSFSTKIQKLRFYTYSIKNKTLTVKGLYKLQKDKKKLILNENDIFIKRKDQIIVKNTHVLKQAQQLLLDIEKYFINELFEFNLYKPFINLSTSEILDKLSQIYVYEVNHKKLTNDFHINIDNFWTDNNKKLIQNFIELKLFNDYLIQWFNRYEPKCKNLKYRNLIIDIKNRQITFNGKKYLKLTQIQMVIITFLNSSEESINYENINNEIKRYNQYQIKNNPNYREIKTTESDRPKQPKRYFRDSKNNKDLSKLLIHPLGNGLYKLTEYDSNKELFFKD